MAVKLTAAQLASTLRLGDSVEETAEVSRLLRYSAIAVVKRAPGAPAEVHNEAAIRLASYLFDQPNAGRGVGYANAIRNSGAGAILLPYRVHRAGRVSEGPRPRQKVRAMTVLRWFRWSKISAISDGPMIG